MRIITGRREFGRLRFLCHFGAVVGIFAAAFFAHFSSASAQMRTVYYEGPAFRFADCHWNPVRQCISGNVTAIATLKSVPANYTGILYGDSVVAYALRS